MVHLKIRLLFLYVFVLFTFFRTVKVKKKNGSLTTVSRKINTQDENGKFTAGKTVHKW